MFFKLYSAPPVLDEIEPDNLKTINTRLMFSDYLGTIHESAYPSQSSLASSSSAAAREPNPNTSPKLAPGGSFIPPILSGLGIPSMSWTAYL